MKWGGAAVTVLLVAVWIGSGWFNLGWDSKAGSMVYICMGRLGIASFSGPDPPGMTHGWQAYFSAFELQWWFECDGNDAWWSLQTPLWMPTCAALILTTAAWRLDTLARRRARVGFCPKCGYDRTGLAAGAVCPECGKLPT